MAPITLVESINSLPKVIFQAVHPWSVWPTSLLVVHASPALRYESWQVDSVPLFETDEGRLQVSSSAPCGHHL